MAVNTNSVPVNKPGALKAKAKELGIDVRELVVKSVTQHDSIQGAARELGVNNGTIYYWLNRAGKEVKRRRALKLVDVGVTA